MSDDEKPKGSITLRTIVTGPEAGSIIGRGGEVVNSIRDESGAKIRIEGSSQQERIITVDGPTDSIFKVCQIDSGHLALQTFSLICELQDQCTAARIGLRKGISGLSFISVSVKLMIVLRLRSDQMIKYLF